jgi:hypothetical protein
MAPVCEPDQGIAIAAIPPITGAPSTGLPAGRRTGPTRSGHWPTFPEPLTRQGFKAISRPHHPSTPQDHFLECNLTTETIVTSPVRTTRHPQLRNAGPQHARCVTYSQQIPQISDGTGPGYRTPHLGGGAADQRSDRGAAGLDPARHEPTAHPDRSSHDIVQRRASAKLSLHSASSS